MINNDEGAVGICKIINHILDPRDWLDNADLLIKLVAEFNKIITFDGYEVIYDEREERYLVREKGKVSLIVKELDRNKALDIPQIRKDFERALSAVDTDPESALTSASSMIESVCKAVLDQLKIVYPAKEDITHLMDAVTRALCLAPDKHMDPEIKRGIKRRSI